MAEEFYSPSPRLPSANALGKQPRRINNSWVNGHMRIHHWFLPKSSPLWGPLRRAWPIFCGLSSGCLRSYRDLLPKTPDSRLAAPSNWETVSCIGGPMSRRSFHLQQAPFHVVGPMFSLCSGWIGTTDIGATQVFILMAAD